MVVAAVAQRAGAERGLGVLQGDVPGPGEGDGHLQRGERLTAVAAGAVDEHVDRLVVGSGLLGVEPAPHQDLDGGAVERLEAEQRRAAAQRRVDLEERVLGGRPDEGDRAVLDRRQQGVLLRLGEAVDLVEEQDRAPPVHAEAFPGTFDDLPHVLDPGGDG